MQRALLSVKGGGLAVAVVAALWIASVAFNAQVAGDQLVLLATSDTATLRKVLTVLEGESPLGYRFSGVTKSPSGQIRRVAYGALPLTQLTQITRQLQPLPHSTAAVVHSSLTDIMVKPLYDRLRAALRGVDTSVYALTNVPVQRHIVLQTTDLRVLQRVLSAVPNEDSASYRFSGAMVESGRRKTISYGALPLEQVAAVSRLVKPWRPAIGASGVHSTLDDGLVAKLALRQIMAALQGVDKSLYRLDVVTAVKPQ